MQLSFQAVRMTLHPLDLERVGSPVLFLLGLHLELGWALPPYASLIADHPRFPSYQPRRSPHLGHVLTPSLFLMNRFFFFFFEEIIVSEQIRKSFLPLSYEQQIAWKLISLIYGSLFCNLKPVISKEIILAIRRPPSFFVLSCTWHCCVVEGPLVPTF